jgi:hypothetical protein
MNASHIHPDAIQYRRFDSTTFKFSISVGKKPRWASECSTRVAAGLTGIGGNPRASGELGSIVHTQQRNADMSAMLRKHHRHPMTGISIDNGYCAVIAPMPAMKFHAPFRSPKWWLSNQIDDTFCEETYNGEHDVPTRLRPMTPTGRDSEKSSGRSQARIRSMPHR